MEYKLTPHDYSFFLRNAVAVYFNTPLITDRVKAAADLIDQQAAEIEQLKKDLHMALFKRDTDPCTLCAHYIKCEGKKCEHFQKGVGCVIEETGEELPNYHWTCEDWEHGSCEVLENTPCNGCDFEKHWQWRGATEVNTSEPHPNTELHWTSVKDRLPEAGMDILVFGKGKMYVSHRDLIYRSPDGKFCAPTSYFQSFEFTHWMPLPEPPKGEDE